MIGLQGINHPWRFRIILFFLFAMGAAIAARIAYLHVFHHEFLAEQGDARAGVADRRGARRGGGCGGAHRDRRARGQALWEPSEGGVRGRGGAVCRK